MVSTTSTLKPGTKFTSFFVASKQPFAPNFTTNVGAPDFKSVSTPFRGLRSLVRALTSLALGKNTSVNGNRSNIVPFVSLDQPAGSQPVSNDVVAP